MLDFKVENIDRHIFEKKGRKKYNKQSKYVRNIVNPLEVFTIHSHEDHNTVFFVLLNNWTQCSLLKEHYTMNWRFVLRG
jgi:hypothetical protein